MRVFLSVSGGLLIVGALLVWSLLPPTLPVPDEQDHVLSGVTILNPGEDLLLDQTIVVVEGRIVEIRSARPDDPVPLCSGCYVMPGLIDAHVHTPPAFVLGHQDLYALLYLAHGVTTVRDVGQSEPGIADLAAALNAGELVGPGMYRCGPVIEGDPPGWPVAEIVETYEAGRAIVERLASEGVDCVKVYNEVGPEAYRGIAERAAELGVPVIGHVPHAVGLSQVSNFEAQHITGIPYVTLPRPPFGYDWRDEDVIALSAGTLREALQLAKDRNVSYTPTLANASLRLIESDRSRFDRTYAAKTYLSPFWLDAWGLVAGHPSGETQIALRLAAVERLQHITGLMHEMEIDVLAGTDTLMPWVVPGEAMWLELEELSLSFNSPEEALRSATSVNGAHIAPGKIGVIAVGAEADLLFLSEDPRESVKAVQGWQFVFADGRLYDRGLVDGWLAEYQSHFQGSLYSGVVGGLVSFLAGQFTHSGVDEG